MKSRSKELLDRAISAMAAAIEIYNKPNFQYRSEAFAILALNAWELLLKAQWLSGNANKISSLYIRESSKGKRPRIKKTKSGRPWTHSLGYLYDKLLEAKILDPKAHKNLQILEELRDSAVHLYIGDKRIVSQLHEISAASVKNFNSASRQWFGKDLSRHSFSLLPLAFVSLPTKSEALVLSQEVENLLKYVDKLADGDDDPSSPYSVTVDVELRFVRSKANDAVQVQVTNDPKAISVKITEEQLMATYPWEYKVLIDHCRDQFEDFKQDSRFYSIVTKLKSDKRYAHIRLLNPANSKSAKKPFFNPNIMKELNKHYKTKRRGSR